MILFQLAVVDRLLLDQPLGQGDQRLPRVSNTCRTRSNDCVDDAADFLVDFAGGLLAVRPLGGEIVLAGRGTPAGGSRDTSLAPSGSCRSP